MSAALSDSLMSQLGSIVSKTTAQISYNGQSISAALGNCTLDLRYKETVNNTSDTVNLSIADPEGLFRQQFTLGAYDKIAASLTTTGGRTPGIKTLSDMFVKTVRVNSNKGGGTVIDIQCVSTPPQSSFRMQKKSNYWNGQTLKQICQGVAGENGWQLQYLASTNPVIQRADQHDHSDANLLDRLCSEQDLVMKNVSGTLYIKSKTDLENQPPVGTMVCPSKGSVGGWNDTGLMRWEAEETTEDIYGSCEVTYTDPLTGRTTAATVVDRSQPDANPVHRVISFLHFDLSVTNPIVALNLPSVSSSPTVPTSHTQLPAVPQSSGQIVNKEPSSTAQAKAAAVATNKLKQKNRKQNKITMTVPLNLKFDAGTTWNMSGFMPDIDSQVWLLSEVQHKIAGKSGSETTLEFTKVPNF